MTVFFGLPVELNEAHRIFGVPVQIVTWDYQASDALRDHLKSFGVNLFHTDKGQYIIGYEFKGLNMWAGEDYKSFVSCRKFLAQLSEMTHNFNVAMKLANADLSVVNLYPMECDTYTVHYPEPFIIEGEEA